MTVEQFELTGGANSYQARVYHSFPDDPTWGVYITLVNVTGDQVEVGAPLACAFPMSVIELQAVVQLISGKIPKMLGDPSDTVDNVNGDCPRCWKTYQLNWV